MESGAAAPSSGRAWWWGLIAAALAFAGLGWLGMHTGSYGFALVVGMPFLCGFIVGRWVRVGVVVRVVVALSLAGSLIAAAVMAHLAGILCGVTFGVVVGVPLILGVLVGSVLFKGSTRSTTAISTLVIAMLIPGEQAWFTAPPEESVQTARIVALPRDEAFSRITFYEDTSLEPPTLLRVALPRPLRTSGRITGVGDTKRCVYESGFLLKQVTAFEPGVRYAFRIREQEGVEDRSVALVGGSFDLTAVDASHTRIVLTTTYRPKLSARLVWRPFERAVVHALHEHVLRQMLAARKTEPRDRVAAGE